MAPEGAEEVRDQIAQSFSRHRRQTHFPGRVVTESDLAFNPIHSRDILLGQIPHSNTYVTVVSWTVQIMWFRQ